MLYRPSTKTINRRSEQTRNKSKLSVFEGKSKQAIQDTGELICQQEACDERKWYANTIQEESFCSSLQNRRNTGVQEESAHDKGKWFSWSSSLSWASESRTGLKPHILKQDLFPLVQCILLYLSVDLAECSAQAPEHSSPREKQTKSVFLSLGFTTLTGGGRVWFSFVF